MCFVSKTRTITSVLLFNLTVPLIDKSALKLDVFCVEGSSDLLLLNLANLSKLGEEMYSLNRWQISSSRSKLALCFIRRSFNKTWNFVTTINQNCGRTDELLSSMCSFNSSSLLTQLSESKVESTKPFICWKSSYSSSYDWVKLDCWNTFVSTPGVK